MSVKRDIKSCGLVDIYQCFCRNMLPRLKVHLQPCTHVWQEQVPLDTFRKSVKDCMLHIPEYSILHSYHPEDLKSHTNASLSMYYVMGLKFIPDYCDKVLHAVNFYRIGFSIAALPSSSFCFVCI